MNTAKFLGEVVAQRTYVRKNEVSLEDALRRFCDHADLTEKTKRLIMERKVVPSMRALQFFPEGRDEMMYNCSYLIPDSFYAFGELLYLLTCGTGVGFSVERAIIRKLPVIQDGWPETFIIGDNRESWSHAIVNLMQNPKISFDYSKIRPKGEKLSIGGTASGPEPLANAIENIRNILIKAKGRQLTSLEVFDIMCYIADAVVVGGVRRSAMIALFDHEDESMMRAKFGEWWRENPQRARANISAVLPLDTPYEEFYELLKHGLQNGGEPGYFFRLHDDSELFDGLNPCGEIGLRPFQFCNLTEVIAPNCKNFEELCDAVEAAVEIGTWQATKTNFRFLRDCWKRVTEEDALLGVSFTGVAMSILPSLKQSQILRLQDLARKTNMLFARKFGINPAKKIFTVKPSGTTSIVYGCSSGVHLPYSKYYIRRVRIDQPHVVKALQMIFGEPQPHEDGVFKPLTKDLFSEQIVLSVPICIETNCGYATDPGVSKQLELLNFMNGFIEPRKIQNGVSCTLNILHDDLDEVASFLYGMRFRINRCTVFPRDNTFFSQAPFEAISESEYRQALAKHPGLSDVGLFLDVLRVFKTSADETNFVGVAACAGGACEIR